MDAQAGAVHLALITRRHCDDSLRPTVFGSSIAFDFCNNILKMDGWDLLRKMDLYSIAAKGGESSTNTSLENSYQLHTSQEASETKQLPQSERKLYQPSSLVSVSFSLRPFEAYLPYSLSQSWSLVTAV